MVEMRKIVSNIILIIAIALIISNCANRGRPSGGIKDITPPTITKSSPENQSLNFQSNEIKIEFDEYIKVKNLQRQLIISPPMDPTPEITPLGNASKDIKIKITDTLTPNTTYTFNFGNSIVDNNEENPFPYFKYVFSTGSYIDSLTVKGQIVDATLRKPDDFVSVMLYEVDSTLTDSIVYLKQPRYITNTLDSTTTFTLENLKAGKYLMVALKDQNQDYKFQPKSDKIAFQSNYINVPSDSSFTLKLFKEELDSKIIRPRLISGEKIGFGFEGDYKNFKIKMSSEVPQDFEYRITKDPKTDTLNYWYNPRIKADSLLFNVSNTNYNEDFTVKISEQPRDTLTLSASPSGALNFNQDFTITGSVPFTSLDNEKITILDKDSVNVNFTTKLDSLTNTFTFAFEKKESERYKVQILPEAFTDFFGDTNDTLRYNLNTKTYADYGNIRVVLKNAEYPVIVQLVTDNDEVKSELYSTKPEPLDFRHLETGDFYLRVIYDTNKNGVYDTGSYLKKRQPERISYYPKLLEIRSNFDYIEEFTLL